MTPSFSIFKPGTIAEPYPTLKHCFLERRILNKNDLPAIICARDGNVYQVAYDSKIPASAEDFEVIISFQSHTYGNYAIVRLAREESVSRR